MDHLSRAILFTVVTVVVAAGGYLSSAEAATPAVVAESGADKSRSEVDAFLAGFGIPAESVTYLDLNGTPIDKAAFYRALVSDRKLGYQMNGTFSMQGGGPVTKSEMVARLVPSVELAATPAAPAN